jgi:hypothetical protein
MGFRVEGSRSRIDPGRWVDFVLGFTASREFDKHVLRCQ